MTQQNNMDLEQRVAQLETQMREHNHDGFKGNQIFLKHIFGQFEVVSSAPTTVPKTAYDNIKIYSSGGTFRIYVYDSVGGAWHYATLT
jgi:hypothetical protein